jgi:hypothetical protein
MHSYWAVMKDALGDPARRPPEGLVCGLPAGAWVVLARAWAHDGPMLGKGLLAALLLACVASGGCEKEVATKPEQLDESGRAAASRLVEDLEKVASFACSSECVECAGQACWYSLQQESEMLGEAMMRALPRLGGGKELHEIDHFDQLVLPEEEAKAVAAAVDRIVECGERVRARAGLIE